MSLRARLCHPAQRSASAGVLRIGMRAQLLIAFLLAACGAGATPPGDSPRSAPNQPVTPAPRGAQPEPPQSAASPPAEASSEQLQHEAERQYHDAKTKKDSAPAWEAAATALARASRSTTDPRREQEFLRSALAAWQESDRLQPSGPDDLPKGKPPVPTPLPDEEIARMAVLARLAELTPHGDPELTRIEYRRGRIYWNYFHLAEAARSFRRVLASAPASAEAEFAAQLLLDTLVRAGDIPVLSAQITAMLNSRELLQDRIELRAQLEGLRHQTGRKSAEELLAGANYAGCAEAYLALYKRDRKLQQARADELLYNASVCTERSNDAARTIQLLDKLVQEMPRSALAAEAKARAEALRADKVP